MTNRELYKMHIQIKSLNEGIAMLLSDRIKTFNKMYLHHCNEIAEKIHSIQKRHLVFNNDKVSIVGQVPVFLEGKTEEEFKKQMNEFLDLKVG